MPWAAGSFTETGSPLVDGDIAEATGSPTALAPKLTDICDGISDTLHLGGTNSPTANIPFAGFKLTGLAAGSTAGDSLRYEQLVGSYLLLAGGTLTGALVIDNDGDATTPDLAFAGDLNTGIYSSAADTIDFTAGGTLRLTLSTSALTSAVQVVASRAGNAGKFTNITDAAANQGIIVESDRATPAAFDQVYISFQLSDSAGNQDEMGRVLTQATVVTSGAETSRMGFSMMSAGAFATAWFMTPTAIHPVSNDGGSVGVSGTAVSDVFIASGGIINWAAGDVLATHSTNTLAFTGASSGYTFDAAITISSVAVKTAGKQTVPVLAGAMTPRVTNGPALATTEHATNDVMVVTLDFDQTTSEGAQFSLPMPKSWNESTVTFQPIWTAAAGSAAQTVIWSMSGLALSDDDAIDQAFGTPQTSSDALIATGDVHIGPESSAITIAGTPAEGDIVIFQITRDISDTLAADARLIAVKVFFTDNAATDA